MQFYNYKFLFCYYKFSGLQFPYLLRVLRGRGLSSLFPFSLLFLNEGVFIFRQRQIADISKNVYLCTTEQGCKVFTRNKCSAAFVRLPMAANIQLVFYRNPKNPKADLLVKALLNEEEATMPLPATSTPFYYRWTDFKNSTLPD